MTKRVNDRRIAFRLHLEPKISEAIRLLAKASGMSTSKFIDFTLRRIVEKNRTAIDTITEILKQLDIS